MVLAISSKVKIFRLLNNCISGCKNIRIFFKASPYNKTSEARLDLTGCLQII